MVSTVKVEPDTLDLEHCIMGAEFIGLGNIPTAPKQGFTDLCAILVAFKKEKCTFCGGLGHETKACATRIRIDRAVVGIGMKFWWGQCKYASYYHKFVSDDQNRDELFRMMSMKYAPNKRFKYSASKY